MKGELVIPNDWMTEYAQYDGLEIEVAVVGQSGFVPPSIYIPHRGTEEFWVDLTSPDPDYTGKTLHFSLMELRYPDDVFVYRMTGWSR